MFLLPFPSLTKQTLKTSKSNITATPHAAQPTHTTQPTPNPPPPHHKMATYSRHHPTSRPIPTKTLPITMPHSKSPLSTYPYPVSRVAASPPDSSSYSSSRHSSGQTYSVPSTTRSAHSSRHSQRSGSSSYAPSAYNDDDREYARGGAAGVDVTEMLSDRMDRLDVSGRKVGMDRHVVRQAQEYVSHPPF